MVLRWIISGEAKKLHMQCKQPLGIRSQKYDAAKNKTHSRATEMYYFDYNKKYNFVMSVPKTQPCKSYLVLVQ